MNEEFPGTATADSPPAKETATELTVTIKDEEKTVKNKFLLYDRYTMDDEDPIIKECIAKTLLDFNGEPSSIKIKVSLVLL